MKIKFMVLAATALSMNIFTSCLTTNIVNSVKISNFEKQQKQYENKNFEEGTSCLVYGLLANSYVSGDIDEITFIQTDSRKQPSRIADFAKIKGVFTSTYFYYGEAVCGGNYNLYSDTSHTFNRDAFGNTITYYYHFTPGLTGGSSFDFKAPSKPCIYYLGNRTPNGQIYNKAYYDKNIKGLKIGKAEDEDFEKQELKNRIKAVEKLQNTYAGTKWEPLLKQEYDSLVAKNGGKND